MAGVEPAVTKRREMTTRYAIGRWESLWASEPFMGHRIVLDLKTKTVVAGQDKRNGRWSPMQLEHVAYMQQILEETYSDIFENASEFEFATCDTLPDWALLAWDWPRNDDPDEELRAASRPRANPWRGCDSSSQERRRYL